MTKSELPPHLYDINIGKAQALRLSGYSLILVFLGAGIFAGLTHTDYAIGFNPGISLIVYFAVLIIHEAIHGFFFALFGGKPKYGAGLMYYFFPYFYATAPGQPYSRSQMTVIGLAPLVLISIITVVLVIPFPGLATYLAVAFIGNFAGAIGDMWLIGQISKFRKTKNLVIMDQRNGFSVYGSGTQGVAVATKLKESERPTAKLNRLTSVWITAFAILLVLNILAPAVLGAFNFQGHILIGPKEFALFEYAASNTSLSISLNPLASIFGSLVFTLLYAIFMRSSKK